MKKLTLGLFIVSTTTALAHDIEYRVCTGDTLSAIAKKFHVKGTAILHANDLTADHHMRSGHYLLIPGVADRQAKASGHRAEQSGYVVRNGDQDWALAIKHGISVHKLHLANPDVDWDHLKIGLRIRIPAGKNTGGFRVASSTHTSSIHGVHMHAHWHKVEDGENDWIIAHKAGIRLPLLKALNPQLDVSNLREGQKVRVPGSAVTRLALHIPRIHSSHVAVNGDNVTIRTEPGVGAESICTVDAGTSAGVLDRNGSWYQLKFPKGTVGWVRGDLLKPLHVVEVAQVTHRHHHEIVEMHVHAHHYVAESHHSHHHAYVTVTPHRRHGGASGIEHESSTSYTALDTDASDADGVLREARNMRGVRYVWGAASRSGTDCSGFTTQVFKRNGIPLPRTSREQAGVGSPISREHLKPGDLVFFHTGRGRRITHVGIYKGNGNFIHASSGSGHVQESSLDDGYYRNRFSTARRVLHHRTHKTAMTESSKKIASSGSSKVAESDKKTSDPETKPVAPASSTTTTPSKSSL